jgi:hypothetical protein
MSRKLLTVVIQELVVNVNGDIPGDKPDDDPDTGLKNNALSASLRYPRSGVPQLTSTKQYDLEDGKPAILLDPTHPDSFFDPLLFREEVIDRTVLNLSVTDRDAASGFEKFLLGLFSTVLGAGFTAVTGGLSGILGAVTGLGIDNLKTQISGAGDESVTVIGQAAAVPLIMDDLSETGTVMPLALTVPDDVVKRGFVIDPVTRRPVLQDFTLLKKGDHNGHVNLLISAVKV